MNLKNFEYLYKDIPFLKRDLLFRASFVVLFFAIYLIQLISMLKNWIADTVNLGMAISSGVVLLTCSLFIFLSILYMLKTKRIINVINNNGRCVSSVEMLFDTRKNSFIRMYSVITEVLAFVASIVCVCGFTYAALDIAFNSYVSFYLPLLATVCSTAYYSVFHLKSELKTVMTVNQYNSIY